MHAQRTILGLAFTLLAAAACSSGSSTGPNGVNTGVGSTGTGGASSTIAINSTTSGGGAYGGGTVSYFFNPTPDTVAAGTAVTYRFAAVTHNVHFDAVANAPDSIPASSNTSIARTFTTPGTYTYHCLIHGFTGVVVVH